VQVPRILNPVVLVLDQLPKLCRDPQVAAYVQAAFGGVEPCRKAILLDFFRHAFDGSGAGVFGSSSRGRAVGASIELQACGDAAAAVSCLPAMLTTLSSLPAAPQTTSSTPAAASTAA
jgi:hypothetical protein